MRSTMLPKKRLGGAVYILPNLLTTGNLFFGYLSIVKSLNEEYLWAATAIMLASIFDVLDGRVARLTGGTSEFGVQYDSLCDLVSFGLAPAILMYQFWLNEINRLGWIICFLFLACGALRLARFNVQSAIGKAAGHFTGLPIPMAALVVASFVLAILEIDSFDADAFPSVLRQIIEFIQTPLHQTVIVEIMAPFLALAMVSNFAYRSHKVIRVSAIKPFRLLVVLVILLGLIAYAPEIIGFVLTLGYAISGPVEWLIGSQKTIDEDDIFTAIAEDQSIMEPDDPST